MDDTTRGDPCEIPTLMGPKKLTELNEHEQPKKKLN